MSILNLDVLYITHKYLCGLLREFQLGETENIIIIIDRNDLINCKLMSAKDIFHDAVRKGLEKFDETIYRLCSWLISDPRLLKEVGDLTGSNYLFQAG